MSDDNLFNSDLENNNISCFKDAICINASRVYDSCSDKDCAENLPIYFTDAVQPLINRAVNVKVKDVEVIDVSLDVEHVPFNKGFYSIDIVFYLKVKLTVIEPAICRPSHVDGLTMFTKKVILYGGEGCVKTFSSLKNNNLYADCNDLSDLPRATIQVSKPISLALELINLQNNYCLPNERQFNIPKFVESFFDGEFNCCLPEKIIRTTIGLFSIIQLERTTQVMVPIYDFCLPNKECDCYVDDPCELFKKIKFPTNEFFPPVIDNDDNLNE